MPPAGYISRPFDPSRRRYYIAKNNLDRVGDFKFLNEDAFKETIYDGSLSASFTNKFYPESSIHRIPAGKNILGEDVHYSYRTGLPKLDERPRVKVALKNKPCDIYGSNSGNKAFFVSTRAKQLFERIDPEAFEFLECETTTRRTLEVEPYWLCAFKRFVMEFDEENSVFVRSSPDHLKLTDGKCMVISANDAFDIRMSPDMPQDYHAFFLAKMKSYPIFSEDLADPWRAEKLTGIDFTPLQTPTSREARRAGHFLTAYYYFEILRKHWEGKI
jgi:Protein of unknown function (DUF1629)